MKITDYNLHKARFLINGKLELSWKEVSEKYPWYYDQEYLEKVKALLPGEITFIPINYDWGGGATNEEIKRL